jgi:hypothetical protein
VNVRSSRPVPPSWAIEDTTSSGHVIEVAVLVQAGLPKYGVAVTVAIPASLVVSIDTTASCSSRSASPSLASMRPRAWPVESAERTRSGRESRGAGAAAAWAARADHAMVSRVFLP